MRVLVVADDPGLGGIWSHHIATLGAEVGLAVTLEAAVSALAGRLFDAIVIDLTMDRRGALSLADLAAFRSPGARVIFVTGSAIFSDGSIFRLSPNAAAFLPRATRPEDLAAIAVHHARPPAPVFSSGRGARTSPSPGQAARSGAD